MINTLIYLVDRKREETLNIGISDNKKLSDRDTNDMIGELRDLVKKYGSRLIDRDITNEKQS